MQKTNYNLLSIIELLLAACTGNVSAQLEEATPTSVIEKRRQQLPLK